MPSTFKQISSLQFKNELNQFSEILRKYNHLYNNRLQPILFNLQFAKDELPHSHPAFQDVSEAEKRFLGTQQLSRHIQDRLIGISKTTALESVNSLCEELTKRIETLNSEGLIVNISCSVDEEKKVSCNSEGLSEIIRLAVENSVAAINYSGVISIEITAVKSSEMQPTPQGIADEYLQMSVKDCGTGIPEELHSKLFLPFTTSNDYDKGLGLSLSRAARFAHQNDGFILIDTGQAGTHFRLFLPIAPNE